MFPLGDENVGMRFKPWVLIGIIVANFVVWFIEASKNNREFTAFLYEWGVIPTTVMEGEKLYTLLTNTFMHGSWGHILGNMLFLWIFGNNLENVMGHFRFLIFYLICGLAGSGLFVLLNQDSQTVLVGASGAIAGVMGGYMRLFPHGKIRSAVFIAFVPVVILIPAWIWVGFWGGTQLLLGFREMTDNAIVGGGVAYAAHVGGIIAGLLLATLFRDENAYAQQQAARANSKNFERQGPVHVPMPHFGKK